MDIDNLCTFRVYSNDGRTFLYAGEEGVITSVLP